LAGQAQAGLEILLDGEKYPLGFSIRPVMGRLGVEEPNAQVGADDPRVVVDQTSH
jgi:hypothetical protein